MRPTRSSQAVGILLLAAVAAVPPLVAHADGPQTPAGPGASAPASAAQSPSASASASASPSGQPAPSASAPAPGSSASSGEAPKTPGHWVYVQEPAPGTSASVPPQVLPPVVPSTGGMTGLYERSTSWDLNIDGAFGRYFGETDKWTGFVRARAGVLIVREPLYSALGFTYEWSPQSNATLGIQAEILHLELGVWGQLGALLDVGSGPVRPGLMGAVGWSLFGVEAQYRTYNNDGLGSGIAVYGKIRIPVSILTRVFSTHHHSTSTKE
jgi:hypothetical protein